jgi:predicted  nucleic acid-binding Zn-ribbon protein
MSQIDREEKELQEAAAEQGEKLVPVVESIRYRKRAQAAEKVSEELGGQLAESKDRIARLSEQLGDAQLEQKLMHKLAGAGAVDLEGAVVIAKSQMEGLEEVDVDGVVEQLKKEKQYLFAGKNETEVSPRTAGAKTLGQRDNSLLQRTAKRAATTGSRTDLHEYLRVRRNFI